MNHFNTARYTFPTLKKIAKQIHEECAKQFVYLCKMIIDSAGWNAPKHQRVYLQNFVVHETLGTNRLMLIQTLGYIIDNDSEHGFQLLAKVPDTLWHALQIWFIELKYILKHFLENLGIKISTSKPS
jgi:hypothetical protein